MIILKKTDMPAFVERLKKSYELFDVTADGLPPKQYFFPPEETTFTFDARSGAAAPQPPPPREFVLYGLALADLEAITCLDSLMSTPARDYYYFMRRKRAVLIGLTDEPFDAPPGGDVILSALDGGSFRVLTVTKKGERVIKESLPRRRQARAGRPGPPDLPSVRRNETMPELKKLFLDTEYLKDAVQWSWRNYPGLWERLAAECLGCGICTYVCPLCHCFSVEDTIGLSGDSGTRRRKWDACTLPGFARVAGGHDFHPGVKERYYNWFYHKFVRSYVEIGRAQCVACGRCQAECPARIDIERVLVDIVRRYEKRKR